MFYVLDENNNKVEAYDKEGVLALLEQAIADGSLANVVADAAFVTKLKCCVTGQTNRVAFTTQANYNALAAEGGVLENCYYFIVDDTTAEDIDTALEELTEKVNSIELCSKKAEARQYAYEMSSVLPSDSELLYYNGTYYGFDLSNLLLSGKTASDTIGIGGTLVMTFNGNESVLSNSVTQNFSVLWNVGNTNYGTITFFGNGVNTSDYYTGRLTLGIDAQNKVYVANNSLQVWSLTGATAATFAKIWLTNLTIYYK